MTVAGRSILEWIVLGLVGDGIRDIYVSVNYLADQIEEHLGDGSRLGCTVRYLREDPDRAARHRRLADAAARRAARPRATPCSS